MSTSAHTLWVVYGTTGEYSDHSEWFVCWQPTQEMAEKMCTAFQEQADEFKAKFDKHERHSDAAIGWRATMLDPWFHMYYTGTDYHVAPMHDDPRAAGEPEFTKNWWEEKNK